MKTARYKNLSFQYEPEHLDIHDLPQMKKEDALSLLNKLQKFSKENGIDVYLAFGTLLGAVREKDFIKGDLDIDVYIKDEKKFFEILPYLKDQGIELIRYQKHKAFSLRDKNCPGAYIDVFILGPTKSIWGIYCYRIADYVSPKRIFKDDGEIVFHGNVYKCPKDPVKALEFWYGKTWNIPLGKFEKKYYYEVPSHHFWVSKIKSPVLKIVKKIVVSIIGASKFEQIRENI